MLMRPLFFFFGFILLLGPLLEAKTVECKPQEKGSEKNEDKDESSEDKKDEKDEEDSDDKDDDKDKEDDKDKKKDDSDADNTVKWGNLALSASQQPGPLVGFGQNMIDAGKWQVLWFGDYIRGKNHYSIDEIPGILYGISDDCSIFFNFPFAARIKEGPNHSSGLEDFFVQLEYAVYTKASTFYTDQVTVVANVSLPTGSSHSNPPTGLGTSSYFTGVTYSHTNVAYMFFTAYGALITTSRCDFRQGNVYLYQLGYVKNINYIPEKVDFFMDGRSKWLLL